MIRTSVSPRPQTLEEELAGVRWTGNVKPVSSACRRRVLAVEHNLAGRDRRGAFGSGAARSVDVVQPARNPIDQFCAIIEARYWEWDDERTMQAMRDLDEAGQALLGRLYRHWVLTEGEGELGDPCGTLVDVAFCYSKTGTDQEIVCRLRDTLSDELHPEQVRRNAEVVAEVLLNCGSAGGVS